MDMNTGKWTLTSSRLISTSSSYSQPSSGTRTSANSSDRAAISAGGRERTEEENRGSERTRRGQMEGREGGELVHKETGHQIYNIFQILDTSGLVRSLVAGVLYLHGQSCSGRSSCGDCRGTLRWWLQSQPPCYRWSPCLQHQTGDSLHIVSNLLNTAYCSSKYPI